MTHNFMDILETVSCKPVKEVKLQYNKNEERIPLLQEEIEDINEFYTAFTLSIQKSKKIVEIQDDGRWMYIQNVKGVFWFNMRTSIYAGYFINKIPTMNSMDENTYTVMIGNPECKALFLNQLLTEYYDKINYKYIGNNNSINIKSDINQVFKYNEPLELILYRVRQLHELACSKATLKPAKMTLKELVGKITSKIKGDTNGKRR